MSSIVVNILLLTMTITEMTESLQQTPVDGGWSSWSNATCSVTCGTGSIIRLRTCTNPEPQNGGADCVGMPFERKQCFNNLCPVNGGWSPWTPYSVCTATCGLAFHTSTRACNNPAPQNGGKQCEGKDTDTQPCRGLPLCAIDGNWSSWSSYSECSVKCGNGTKTRTRTCNDPPPQYGGLECAGNASESLICTANECPVDGGWSSWISTGSECSVQCGRGSKIRIRTCTNPAPHNGGRNCPGSRYESTSCMLKECPVNGRWSPWTPYSTCTATCGVGYQTSTRTCTNPAPQFGGQPCFGKSNDTRICPHLPLCPETTISSSAIVSHLTVLTSTPNSKTSNPIPVDGGWSPWSNASCSVTCGIGSIIQLRFCTNPKPRNGGKQCEGTSYSRHTCNNGPCPINGGWSAWTPYSECTATCGLAFHTSTRKCNNPAPQNGGKPCKGNDTDTQHCRGLPLCTEKTTEPMVTKTNSDHQTTMTLSASTATTVHTSTPSRRTTASTPKNKTTIHPPVTSPERLETTVLGQKSTTESLLTESSSTTISQAYSSTISQTSSSNIPQTPSTTKTQTSTTKTQTSSTTVPQTPSTTKTQTSSTTVSQSSGGIVKPQIGVVMVSFAVYIDKSFDDKLLDQSSDLYKETLKTVQEVLNGRFKETPGFLVVTINSFSYGSIRVNYSVSVDGAALSTEKTIEQLVTKATQWTPKEPVFFGYPVNVDKTAKDIKSRDITNELLNKRNKACTCPTNDYRCDFSEGEAECRHLCLDINCGKHGICFVDSKTKLPKCFCKQSNDSKIVYLGEKCEKIEALGDKEGEPNNMTMISITAGVGGGVILFIIIAFICVCRKVQEQKKLLVSNRSSLSHLDNLEHNKISKSNFYFEPNTTHNPLYKESEEEKLKSNSEQIVRIFLHVAPEKHRSVSMHSINTNGEEQNLYMEGSHIAPTISSMIVPNLIHRSSERLSITNTENEADRHSIHTESIDQPDQEELS